MGAYGGPSIRTPCLDELARSAVISDHHVLSSFPTMPAGADILTGRFSYTHRVCESLPRYLLTLPEISSRVGYLTIRIVDALSYVRNGFGFDDFVRVRGQGDDINPKAKRNHSLGVSEDAS